MAYRNQELGSKTEFAIMGIQNDFPKYKIFYGIKN